MSAVADPRLIFDVAFERYVSTVRMGGTKEQRAWAFARALVELERLMVSEGAGRAKRSTEEMEAVG